MATYATNQKARFDYEILETMEAGLVLAGFEVKSIRSSKVSIQGAYVKIFSPSTRALTELSRTSSGRSTEAWLVGAIVSPYQANNVPPDYDPQRSRKLLLKKSELKYLIGKSQERGLTLIPLKVFDAHGLIKLELGIGRGKKKYDKREIIKKREEEKKIRRIVG